MYKTNCDTNKPASGAKTASRGMPYILGTSFLAAVLLLLFVFETSEDEVRATSSVRSLLLSLILVVPVAPVESAALCLRLRLLFYPRFSKLLGEERRDENDYYSYSYSY